MAELNINERQAGDVTVLDMSGKITIGEGSVALRTAIRRLLEEGKKRILLNLAGVSYIDSSGIGELVSSYTAINKEEGQLKLLNLTQKLQDLLAITKLLTVFDVYENEAEALNVPPVAPFSRMLSATTVGTPDTFGTTPSAAS